MKTVYLAGAIADCTDQECMHWREEVETFFAPAPRCVREVHVINPMQRDYRDVRITVENSKEVVEFDKVDIARSDVVLANIIKPSVGTSMEVLYAHTIGKIVVIYCEEGMNLSPWLVYHSHRIFHDLKEAVDWIKSYG